MTTKDIRDIAAYLGSPFTAKVFTTSKPEPLVPLDLQNLIEGNYSNFKLHLRKLSSLIEGEIKHIAHLAGAASVDRVYEEKYYWLCECRDSESERYEIKIYGGGDGLIVERIQGPIFKASTIAYLQSIGVYVPGTISEEFVMLID